MQGIFKRMWEDNIKVVLRHVKWAELPQVSSTEGFCGYCNGASGSIKARIFFFSAE